MNKIKLDELTKMLTLALSCEIQAAIKVAEISKNKQDIENFLMAQSYVMGLQKAAQIINDCIGGEFKKDIIVEN